MPRQRVGLNLILALAMLLTLGVSAAHGAPPPQEEMTYAVKPGDNLWTLAEKYLSNGHASRDIVAATNARHEQDPTYARIENPNLIHPGWKILIPSTSKESTMESVSTSWTIQAVLDELGHVPLIGDVTHSEEDFSALFCSEMAAAGLEAGGAIGSLNCSEVTPIDMFRFAIYQGTYYQIKGPKTLVADFNTIDPEGWGE